MFSRRGHALWPLTSDLLTQACTVWVLHSLTFRVKLPYLCCSLEMTFDLFHIHAADLPPCCCCHGNTHLRLQVEVVPLTSLTHFMNSYWLKQIKLFKSDNSDTWWLKSDPPFLHFYADLFVFFFFSKLNFIWQKSFLFIKKNKNCSSDFWGFIFGKYGNKVKHLNKHKNQHKRIISFYYW